MVTLHIKIVPDLNKEKNREKKIREIDQQYKRMQKKISLNF